LGLFPSPGRRAFVEEGQLERPKEFVRRLTLEFCGLADSPSSSQWWQTVPEPIGCRGEYRIEDMNSAFCAHQKTLSLVSGYVLNCHQATFLQQRTCSAYLVVIQAGFGSEWRPEIAVSHAPPKVGVQGFP